VSAGKRGGTGKTKAPRKTGRKTGAKPAAPAPRPLFTGPAWDYDTLQRTFDAIEQVALQDLGLDPYPTRLEVITSEQMLDAYAATGLPIMYPHWSFGKRFAQQDMLYRKGMQSLALEIVINSNPSICYVMEENTMATQATVIAHAAMGHNHFFKNNQVFRRWTKPDTILDDLRWARGFVQECEERHGHAAVERVLDAAHALFAQGVDRNPRADRRDPAEARRQARERRRAEREAANDLWLRTVPQRRGDDEGDRAAAESEAERRALGLPEENLLYFLETHAPLLEDWQRELLRIVRELAIYF
jgi:stage V sporulation protein R